MKWIKCFERLPDRRYNFFVKRKAFNGDTYNSTSLFSGKIWDGRDEVTVWLDESIEQPNQEDQEEMLIDIASEMAASVIVNGDNNEALDRLLSRYTINRKC